MNSLKDQWYTEDPESLVVPQYVKIKWKIKKLLFSGKSEYQTIEFYDTYDHGILFALDKLIMTTERDEFIYHEMLTHILLFTYPKPKRVLIIGGGDCGALREVIKHPDIEEIHLCELDQMVVEKCKEYLPYVQIVLKDKRVKTFFEDGFNFLEKNKNSYDIIIVDSTDPIGEAEKLFDEEFIKLCSNSLTEDGMMTMQCGSPFYNTDFILSLQKTFKKIFPVTMLYTASTHSYPGGFWGFSLGSKKYNPQNDFREEKYNQYNLGLQYYNQDIHNSAFALPSYMKNVLKNI